MDHFESQYPPETMRDEAEKTLRLLEAGNFVQAVGLPGTGKSTLLRLLAYNSEVKKLYLGDRAHSYHFVYLNFAELKKRNLGDVTKLMLFTLQDSLEKREARDEAVFVQEKLEAALRLDDELVYFQYLKQCIEHLATENLKIVLLIDRLEVYFPYLDGQFFSNLRILRNSAKYSFSVVFSLSRPLDMTLENSLIADIYDLVAGNTVFVGIHHPEGLEFRTRHLEETLGKQGDEDTKQQIIRLTGGHGKLTKLSYEALLTEGSEVEELDAFLLGRRQVRGALAEIWNYFTLEEQGVLLAFHSSSDEENKGSEVQMQNSETVSFLNSLGILSSGRVAIPLLTTYIQERSHDLRRLSYSSEKGVILRGGVDITELFSRSEFRLLQYLLQHLAEVVSRDSLIEYIWGDLATTEGVTPQAFDQLVYRVRKKIEPDPTHPALLTTVKGRGYKMQN